MPRYEPTPGPLPGVMVESANSELTHQMSDDFCCRCVKDADEDCPIVAHSFGHNVVEWREIDGEVKCIAFLEPGQVERCASTEDMFDADGK
jgi:hypothetical protein